MARFDVVVESSKIGVRKPEPAFYALACELLGVEPAECVFLDDLGINLKPAREMGMTTIKVGEPAEAIAELEAVLGIPTSPDREGILGVSAAHRVRAAAEAQRSQTLGGRNSSGHRVPEASPP